MDITGQRVLMHHAQGCGMVTMSSIAEAMAAMEGLNGKHIWGQDKPAFMVQWTTKTAEEPDSEGKHALLIPCH